MRKNILHFQRLAIFVAASRLVNTMRGLQAHDVEALAARSSMLANKHQHLAKTGRTLAFWIFQVPFLVLTYLVVAYLHI